MNRRKAMTLMATSAAVLVPSLAFAEHEERERRGMSEADERHGRDTLEVGGISLATSELAKDRARNRWVKKFAEYEADEQQVIKDVLTSAGARAPEDENEEKREAVRKLRELRGEEFDEAYLKAQTDGHRRLLQIQNTYIKNGEDKDRIGQAKLARGQIKEHLDLIDTIRDQMRT